MKKHKVSVPYMGGKFSLLKHILPQLPESKIFVDVFGGGGSVVYNKRPASKITIYNDLSSEVYIFFKVLREQYDELRHLLEYTPFSYQLFKEAYTKLRKEKSEGLSELQRAWYWFVLIRQSYATRGDAFARALSSYGCRHFHISVSNLKQLSDFFKGISIDNIDYWDLMQKYDSENTLFYCDPPYLAQCGSKASSEGYFNSFSFEDHKLFLDRIKTLKGKVCVSHYKVDLYDSELSDWRKVYFERKITTVKVKDGGKSPVATEGIYCNYEIDKNIPDIFHVEQLQNDYSAQPIK